MIPHPHFKTRPINWYVAGAMALVGLVASCAEQPMASPNSAGGGHQELGHLRVERSFQKATPWTVTCDGDSCGGVELARITLRTPGTVAAVDLTLDGTVNIQINDEQGSGAPEDYAMVGADFGQDCSGRFHDLNPGLLPLRAPVFNEMTTTSVTFTRGSIAADGRTYCVLVAVVPRDGNGDRVMSVSGSKFAAVAETWPTGL